MESSKTNDLSTECASPPPLSDDQLLDALDGHTSAQVQAHLNRCEFCAARLEGMRMFERTLQTAMYWSNCPTTEALTDYVMGELQGSARLKFDDHLQRCSLCREEVQTLQTLFVTDAVSQVNEPAPEPLWEQVKDFFQSLEAQIVRILVPQPIPAYGSMKGSEGKRDSRILSYGNDPVSVMLSLEKVGEGLKVVGDIIDTEAQDRWRGSFVELVRLAEDPERYLAQVDDEEQFIFNSIIPGRYNLSIYVENEQILRLQDVEITL